MGLLLFESQKKIVFLRKGISSPAAASKNLEKRVAMKKWFEITLALLLTVAVTTAAAQEKIVERSAAQQPAWVGGIEPECLVVTATDADLETAKRHCLEDIRQQVINTVAMNISSTGLQDRPDGTGSESASYRSELQSAVARMPYVSGITLADSEIYWERRLVKKEKRCYYRCCVKYPFTQLERYRLIRQFQKEDQAQYDKYLELKALYDTFTQLEEVDRCINELDPLIDCFFDAPRRDEAVALQRSFRQIYYRVEVVPVSNTPGEYLYELTVDGRTITSNRLPRTKSDFATAITVTPQPDGCYRVAYRCDGCRPKDANTVDLLFTFGSRDAKHTFHFDLHGSAAEVFPQGTVRIELFGTDENPEIIGLVNIEFNLRSKSEAPFIVREVGLVAEGLSQRINAGMAMPFEGKGTHCINFSVACPQLPSDKRKLLTAGYVTLFSPDTGRETTVPLALPYTITKR